MHRKRRDFLLLLKPLRVEKVEIERKRLDLIGGQALACQEALDRVPSQRVEMPIAGRSKIQSLRHVRLPKLHRLSDHHVINAEMLGIGGRCESEGSGTDDEQVRANFHKPLLKTPMNDSSTSVEKPAQRGHGKRGRRLIEILSESVLLPGMKS